MECVIFAALGNKLNRYTYSEVFGIYQMGEGGGYKMFDDCHTGLRVYLESG